MTSSTPSSLPWLQAWLVVQVFLGAAGILAIAWQLTRRTLRGADGANHPSGFRIWMEAMLSFAACVLVFLSAYKVSGRAGITGVELDSSWPLVMEYALKQGWQWGKEVVYTMGPLGAFFSEAGLGGFCHERILFGWGQALLMAYAAWRLGQMLPRWLRLALWLWVILFTPSPVVLCAIVAVILMTPPGDRWVKAWETLALPAGCALLALVKFTDFTAALGALGFFGVRELAQGRCRRLAAVLLSFAGFFLLGWCAAGQSPMNLPAYIRNSGEISFGFHTMSQPATLLMLGWGLALVGSLLLTAGTAAAFPSGSRWDATLRLAPVLFCSFLSWKHGFTRADGHVAVFFCSAFPYACLMAAAHQPLAPQPGRRTWRSLSAGAALLTLALCIGSLSAGHLTTLDDCATSLKAKLAPQIDAPWSSAGPSLAPPPDATRWQLPTVRQLVGRSTVDVFNYRQGYAFINGLNYRPRPVFQSFSSYTPHLQQLNLAWYLSPAAPECVLFRPESIDGRLAWLDDAPLLANIMAGYAPVGREKGFLVMKRSPAANLLATEWKEVLSGDAKWGHPVKLPPAAGHELYVLKVSAPRSLLGRIKRMVYQPANGQITLRLDDGGKVTRPFIPEMAAEGFLLTPWMENVDDILGWMTGLTTPKHVASFSLLPWGGYEGEFTARYHYTLLKGPGPAPADPTTADEKHPLAACLYPYLPGIPEVIQPSMEVRMRSDLEACCARAPTHLEFTVPSYAKGVSGRFAFECTFNAAGAENVTCRAMLLDAANKELGRWEKTLCPQSRPTDEEDQFLDFDFPATAGPGKVRLVLESTSDAQHNRALTWWGPIHWKPPAH